MMQLHLAIAVAAVFVQVGLTFWAIYQMGRARISEIQATKPDMAQAAIGQYGNSTQVKLYENNAHNQFETPPLLYAGVALAAALGASNWGVAIGAATYAALRLVHRQIHVGSNRIATRFMVYTYGFAALIVLWLSLAVGLFL